MTDAQIPTPVSLDLAELRRVSEARQAAWCPEQVPDLSFRGVELAGEVGEACNVIKKLERERLGWRGSRAMVDDLADELADVVICADLAAMAASVDLSAAVVRKFNATSDKVGLPHKLAAPKPAAPAELPTLDEVMEVLVTETHALVPVNRLRDLATAIQALYAPAIAAQAAEIERLTKERDRYKHNEAQLLGKIRLPGDAAPTEAPKPVAWMYHAEGLASVFSTERYARAGKAWTETPLYAAPPEPADVEALRRERDAGERE